jgi:uncharacterized cupin superfamily protein
MLEPTAVLLAHADGSPVLTKFTPGSLGANDPFDRQIAYVGPYDMAAGVVQASGQFSVDDYPYSETIVVHAGQVTLRSQDCTLQLNPGDSAVIARGTSLQIEAQPDSFWAFCADTQPVEACNRGLTPLPPLTLLSPSAAPDAEILLSPAPYTRRARPHMLHELMHLLEGSVTLQIADGTHLTVNTGDTVFVPRGAPCAWNSSVYVRKFYVVK